MLLAQTNLALFRWPLDDSRMASFVEQIDPVNEAAEQSEGFVWRFKGEYRPRGMIQPWSEPLLFFNLSVWQDFQSLAQFLRLESHQAVMRTSYRWTKPVSGASAAMWWIDDESRPTVGDAILAINLLDEIGESKRAFSSRSPYRWLEYWLKA